MAMNDVIPPEAPRIWISFFVLNGLLEHYISKGHSYLYIRVYVIRYYMYKHTATPYR